MDKKTLIFADECLLPMQYVYCKNILRKLKDIKENEPVIMAVIEHIHDIKSGSLFTDISYRHAETIISYDKFIELMSLNNIDGIDVNFNKSEILSNFDKLDMIRGTDILVVYTNKLEQMLLEEYVTKDKMIHIDELKDIKEIGGLYCANNIHIKKFKDISDTVFVPQHRLESLYRDHVFVELIENKKIELISLYNK